jgi:hypothetical protein
VSKDPWLVYRETVPEEVRLEIKDQILTAAVDGFEDFLQVTQNITASILCGDIHPEVAKEARAYLELALTAVTAKAMEDKAKGSNTTVNTRLAAVRKKRGALPAPQPEFTIDIEPSKVISAPWEGTDEVD